MVKYFVSFKCLSHTYNIDKDHWGYADYLESDIIEVKNRITTREDIKNIEHTLETEFGYEGVTLIFFKEIFDY
jgi:hypothetical protein|nr:MAG TPA: hypothetical protein [Inoviridae sp.]